MSTIEAKKGTIKKRILKEFRHNWILYLMVIPVLAYYIIFKYIPMYGITLAFKEYNSKLGIINSPWVGLKHFQRFFTLYNFEGLIKNTLTLSIYSICLFPIPVIFAVMLNYLTKTRLKKFVQMVSYAPYFISVVVICAMISLFFGQDDGAFNLIRGVFGLEPVNYLMKPDYFKHLYTWSGEWQSMGFGAIIYISALAGVDYQMHEAAIIDGASKIQRIIHIDIPSISSTIIMLFILRFGSLMNVGFEKVFLLQNDLNSSASNIISTYVYEVGMIDRQYGFSTAVSLFNTIINVILMLSVNALSKKVLHESVF